MITTAHSVDDKVSQIINELKALKLWKEKMPEWVTAYSDKQIRVEDDFASWLQFIFLPNMQNKNRKNEQKELVAPQAIKYFGEDVRRGKLLQLLIELDSL
jgi:uncharacterized protein YqcC (DUF446 family)